MLDTVAGVSIEDEVRKLSTPSTELLVYFNHSGWDSDIFLLLNPGGLIPATSIH